MKNKFWECSLFFSSENVFIPSAFKRQKIGTILWHLFYIGEFFCSFLSVFYVILTSESGNCLHFHLGDPKCSCTYHICKYTSVTFSLLYCCSIRFHTGSGAHPASYPVGTGGPFPRNKGGGAWSWPLTSFKCWGQMHGTIPPPSSMSSWHGA